MAVFGFKSHKVAALLAVVSVIPQMSSQAFAAQVAAAIQYEVVKTPTLPPNDQPSNGMQYMQAAPGSTLSYLSITTVDGLGELAALWRPVGKSPANTTMIISIHGGGNDFTQNPVRALGIHLSPKGYAVLAINDRQSGSNRQNKDNFYDISTDIDAAVRVAKAMGYRRIVIHGQSMGTIHVIYYSATHWDPAIKGVILTAAGTNIAWMARNMPEENEDGITSDNYEKIRNAAHNALKAGHFAKELPINGIVTPDHIQTGLPADQATSAQNFLTYQDDISSGANAVFWIQRIPYPILNLRSQSDNLIHPFESNWLMNAARDRGSLVPEFTFVEVPDAHPPSVQGHVFASNTPMYISTVLHWLVAHKL